MGARGTDWPRTAGRALPACLCGALLSVLLIGCEAPLDLAGVNDRLSRPTQRADLFQAVARHEDTVIAVGGMGTIVRSPDRGNSWQRTILSDKPFLLDIVACPDGNFFAIDQAGGLWSARADGHWTRQVLPEINEPQAMACDAANVIWVVGGFATIVHSGDGGTSWETWSLDDDLYLTTIQFVDRQHGVATGEFGTVLLTADGGVTWNRASDLPGSFYPQSAYFSSPSTGWIVGLNGTIWKTLDGAQSWQRMASGSNKPLYGVTGTDDMLVAVGDNATILYHRTGAASWRRLDGIANSRTYLRGIAGLGDGRFTAVGGGAIVSIAIPERAAPAQDAR